MAKQVAGGKTLLEKIVHHVFGRKKELDLALIGGAQGVETRAEVLRRIGNVLHYVRCQPKGLHSLLLEEGEDGKGLVKGAHPVVDPRKDVAVIVNRILQEARPDQG